MACELEPERVPLSVGVTDCEGVAAALADPVRLALCVSLGVAPCEPVCVTLAELVCEPVSAWEIV